MNFDTLITHARAVTPQGIESLDIGIIDGKIAALMAAGSGAQAHEIIDAGGKLVLPGAVDIHFHCRAPGYPERGDFSTETRAAAAGGVTTVFEMPISKPCCATGDVFRARKKLGEENVYVNFGLYAAPGLLDADEIADMVNEGAIGFKIFTTSPPAGRDDEFEGLCLPDVTEMYRALQLVKDTGLVLAVHAENESLIQYHTQQLKDAGRNDVTAHAPSRPPVVEAVAVAELLTLNETVGARLHIVHMTSRAAVDVLRRFQAAGVNATGETCPQYLFFTEDDMPRVGPYGKINPPLRSADDQAALWDAILDGTLVSVTTDHSPFTVEEKERARTNIWMTPPGAAGVQELVLGMMDAALKGRLTIEQAVNLIATNGAKLFGIYPQKGAIIVDADADLVIYDPEKETTIHPDMLFSKAKDCDKLYEGMTFQGRIDRTIVNGRTVFVDGEIVGKPGWGRFVRPIRNTVSQES